MDGNKYRFSDYSSQSVICSVDKFVKTVDHMNETVMVPSRLLNVELSEKDQRVPDLLKGSSDPYTFYTVLNNLRNNVVWGVSDNKEEESKPTEFAQTSHWSSHNENEINCNSTTLSFKGEMQEKKGHQRKISSISMNSVASTSNSSECSERLSDAGDSGVDSEEIEPVTEITLALKEHLLGLQSCLSRLSETASYITEIYQEEVKV